jgi:MFS family permease
MAGRFTVVAALGATQTLAWASSYYLPAVLADPIAAELGFSREVVFGAFSGALLLAAALGPSVGRAIDRQGGRNVLVLSNLVFAASLALLATARGPVAFGAAWTLLGVGMGLGLYDSAFAALATLYGRDARGAITGVTLIAGFASTVGWPTSAFLLHAFGWRDTCLAWAALHLLAGLPLNGLVIPKALPHDRAQAQGDAEPIPGEGMIMFALAFVFAAAWFVSTAMAAHLPRLLQAIGVSPTAAVAAGALVGPAQVAARLFEFGLMRRRHPLVSARLATILHPLGAALLVPLGAPAAAAFALLHGAGNGLLTIAKGTLPLAIFGPRGYGYRSGVLSAPARIAQAAAPLAFGLLLDREGPTAALIASSALCLASFAVLLALPARSLSEASAVADMELKN